MPVKLAQASSSPCAELVSVPGEPTTFKASAYRYIFYTLCSYRNKPDSRIQSLSKPYKTIFSRLSLYYVNKIAAKLQLLVDSRQLLVFTINGRPKTNNLIFRWPWRRGTPLTIPNREVKPVSADGTATPSGRVGSRLLRGSLTDM